MTDGAYQGIWFLGYHGPVWFSIIDDDDAPGPLA